jgi:hypothetical protein
MASGRMYSADPEAAAHVLPLGLDDTRYTADEQGPGWVSFAGVMLAIVGVLNVLYGVAAISNSKFYLRDVAYVIGDLNTWGWFLVVLGACQFLAAFGIWTGSQLGRWIGIVSAGGNAILQLIFLPSYPLLAITIFAVDVLVLYALIAFAGRPAST